MTAVLPKHKWYENVELAAFPYLEDKGALCRGKGQAERATQEIKTKPPPEHLYKIHSQSAHQGLLPHLGVDLAPKGEKSWNSKYWDAHLVPHLHLSSERRLNLGAGELNFFHVQGNSIADS